MFWGLIASMWVGNLLLVVLNLPLIGVWVRMLRVPYQVLFPAIVVFAAIGCYSLGLNAWDVYLIAGLGVIANRRRCRLHRRERQVITRDSLRAWSRIFRDLPRQLSGVNWLPAMLRKEEFLCHLSPHPGPVSGSDRGVRRPSDGYVERCDSAWPPRPGTGLDRCRRS